MSNGAGVTVHARARDGATVASRRWDARRPRGHALLLQGRGDFLDKDAAAAQRLVELGLTTLWWDWRGQGESQNLGAPLGAGHVDSFEDYLADLDAVLALHADLPGPRVLVGHSMGGLVAALHLLRRPSDAASAVLVSPMLGFRGTPPSPVVHAVARTATLLGRGRRWASGERWTPPENCTLEANMATSDPDAFARMQTLRVGRPHGLVTGSTWGWTAAATGAMARLRRADLSAVTTDVLIGSAPADPGVDPSAHHDLARRLPRGRVVEYPGRHDLLWESVATTRALWHDIQQHVARTVAA